MGSAPQLIELALPAFFGAKAAPWWNRQFAEFGRWLAVSGVQRDLALVLAYATTKYFPLFPKKNIYSDLKAK